MAVKSFHRFHYLVRQYHTKWQTGVLSTTYNMHRVSQNKINNSSCFSHLDKIYCKHTYCLLHTCKRTAKNTTRVSNPLLLFSRNARIFPVDNITYCKTANRKENQDSYLYIPVRYMAGHSHYANIKDTKGKMDAQKAARASIFASKMLKVIKDGGSADPKKNSALEKLIKEGKKQNIPLSSIERILKRESVKGSSSGGTESYFEYRAPGGIMLIIAAMDYAKGKYQISAKLKKHPEFTKGNCMSSFDHKGVITVIIDKNETIDMDTYLDIAIEVGAEDVELEKDDESDQVLKFICDAKILATVKKEIEARDLQVVSAETIFIPLMTVAVDEEQMSALSKVIDKLLEAEHLSDVYTNAVVEQS